MKVAFFYANGTASLGPFGLLDFVGKSVKQLAESLGAPRTVAPIVAGMHGMTASWEGVLPQNDPFCQLLDPTIFDARKIAYPAATIPIGASMAVGIANTMSAINALPAGTPWTVGGFSQGAAVMSSIYNEVRSGSLTSRANSFLGGVCFGNPRRQLNYRGSVGGTWSGAIGTAGSTTGGHGAFPTTGEYARLTGCEPAKWIEFVHPGDIFSAVGDSTLEAAWTNFLQGGTALATPELLDFLFWDFWNAPAMFGMIGDNSAEALFTDAVGTQWMQGGGGHVAYPFVPPQGNPDGDLTAYQIAIKFLETRAQEWATAPIALPDTPISSADAGWSTTLIPPAA